MGGYQKALRVCTTVDSCVCESYTKTEGGKQNGACGLCMVEL